MGCFFSCLKDTTGASNSLETVPQHSSGQHGSGAADIPANSADRTAVVVYPLADPDALCGDRNREVEELKRKFKERRTREETRIRIRATDDSESEQAVGTPGSVLLQNEYSGSQPVISCSDACISCSDLGREGLLNRINQIMGTSHSLEGTAGISEHIDMCIERNYDFGTAYGRLLPWWSAKDLRTLRATLAELEANDERKRKDALDSSEHQITTPQLPPRRVWCLRSNRVIPFWVIRSEMWAISHSWMNKDRRRYVETRINAKEWKVPIPNDTTLERVRIELLNLGAVYVWLDVLCLRQEDSEKEKEDLRDKEWKLDVPTIGYAYHQNRMVVHYYCGLGRPFRRADLIDLTNDRHWLNRAWTLQEISPNGIIGGKAADSPESQEVVDSATGSRSIDSDLNEFFIRLGSLQAFAQELGSIFPALIAMRGRSATSELDKVAGLAYLLRSDRLPAYIVGQCPEAAWTNLLKVISPKYRGDLLFLGQTWKDPHSSSTHSDACQHCRPSDHNKWAPSWEQVMKGPIPPIAGTDISEEVCHLRGTAVYAHYGYRLDGCQIRGLELQKAGDIEQLTTRRGSFITPSGQEIEVESRLSDSIPDGEYTLVGGQKFAYCVVARVLPTDPWLLEKISVLRVPDSEVQHVQKLVNLDKKTYCRWAS